MIVGWALDIKGQLPNMTAHLEALHQRNFGGKRQILFLMDSLECEVVLTGRDPAPELTERADYITSMEAVRHPFEQGITAREGIEF